tara:strand:+ start:74 stop:193 length:120 start_codon:yes stop_codon:yes gene_type:complete
MNKLQTIKKLIIDLQSSDSMWIYKTPELMREILNMIEDE